MAGTLARRATVREGALGVEPRSVLDSGLHRLDGVGDRLYAPPPVAEGARLRARRYAHEPAPRHLQRRDQRRHEARVDPAVRAVLRAPPREPRPARSTVVVARPLVRGGQLLLLVP